MPYGWFGVTVPLLFVQTVRQQNFIVFGIRDGVEQSGTEPDAKYARIFVKHLHDAREYVWKRHR